MQTVPPRPGYSAQVRWVLLVLLLAGCAQNPDLTVSLYQTRTDTPVDKIEIQVQNNEAQAVTVQRAKLVSTALSAFPVWEEPVTIPPRRSTWEASSRRPPGRASSVA